MAALRGWAPVAASEPAWASGRGREAILILHPRRGSRREMPDQSVFLMIRPLPYAPGPPPSGYQTSGARPAAPPPLCAGLPFPLDT